MAETQLGRPVGQQRWWKLRRLTTAPARRSLGLLAVLLAAASVATACFPRTSGQIWLAEQQTISGDGVSIDVDFYRNPAYDCGLSGSYTFSVFNPIYDPDGAAPLWVYLHGGGVGYFDQWGGYHATVGASQHSWNHEESASGLVDHVVRRTIGLDGQPMDTTLTRRITQGYRVLVVSMCDHDLYAGTGSPYPNSPTGDTTDGLLATLAAVDYTTANYETTHVFAHGTSAGSVGAFALAFSLAAEQRPLTGVVADSYVVTDRNFAIFDTFAGAFGFPFGGSFEVRQAIEKVGLFADPSAGLHPEAQIASGFVATPVLFVGGDADPFCGGNQLPVPEAAAFGLNNCDWVYDGVRNAVANQPNSPHRVAILDGVGHVPTSSPGQVNDIVDAFLYDVMSAGPAPFSD
jgi:acetyl esterase/lipase